MRCEAGEGGGEEGEVRLGRMGEEEDESVRVGRKRKIGGKAEEGGGGGGRGQAGEEEKGSYLGKTGLVQLRYELVIRDSLRLGVPLVEGEEEEGGEKSTWWRERVLQLLERGREATLGGRREAETNCEAEEADLETHGDY